VPLFMTAIGLLILGLAPQAQDLFIEFADASSRIPLFLLLLVFVWAMPTHYTARLLLDTDERFQRAVASERAAGQGGCHEILGRYVPRLLGLLTFVAVLIAIWRSYLNVPSFGQPNDQLAVDTAHDVLRWLAVFVVLLAAGFLIYTVARPRNADLPGLRALKDFNRRLAPLWRKISPGLRDQSSADTNASRDVGRFLLTGIFIIFVAIFL